MSDKPDTQDLSELNRRLVEGDKPLAEQFREAIDRDDEYAVGSAEKRDSGHALLAAVRLNAPEILRALEWSTTDQAMWMKRAAQRIAALEEERGELGDKLVDMTRIQHRLDEQLRAGMALNEKHAEVIHLQGKRIEALEEECNRLRPIAHHCPDGKRVEALEEQLRAVTNALAVSCEFWPDEPQWQADEKKKLRVLCCKAREVLDGG